MPWSRRIPRSAAVTESPVPPVTGGPRVDHELVVLVDATGRPVGTAPKATVHTARTPRHLAFSVYVFDSADRFLVTRRALTKSTWPGVWTNSCCGHVGPDEPVVTAAQRRLGEELGVTPSELQMVLPDFAYRATSPDGLVENELCPVLVARVDGDPVVAAGEVVEWQWSTWADFRSTAQRTPWALSPWSVLQVAQLPARLPDLLTTGVR